MLDLAKVGPADVVYDLGSGDGRIVIDAVQTRGVKRAVGIDLNPVQATDAKANAEKAGVTDRVTFTVGDVFKVDLAPATVVTMCEAKVSGMSLLINSSGRANCRAALRGGRRRQASRSIVRSGGDGSAGRKGRRSR